MKDQIQSELTKLLPQIELITKLAEEAEDDWTAHYNREDPNDLYLRSMFNSISDKLDDARRLMQQAVAPVVEEGMLQKRSDGRYGNRKAYYTSGSAIEYLLQVPDADDR